MCRSKNNIIFLVLFFQLLSCPLILLSQEWSAEQKEAWAMVEKRRNFWVNRDLEGYMSCLHENFMGWYDNSPLPINKKYLRNWENHWLSTVKIKIDEIRPVSIKITTNIAIINFYTTSLRETPKEEKLIRCKWTEILIKENGKWLILGKHGGSLDSNNSKNL